MIGSARGSVEASLVPAEPTEVMHAGSTAADDATVSGSNHSVGLIVANGASIFEFGIVAEFCNAVVRETLPERLSLTRYLLGSDTAISRDGFRIALTQRFEAGQIGSTAHFAKHDLLVVLTGDRLSEQERTQLLRICRWCIRSGTPCIFTGAAIDEIALKGFVDEVVVHWSKVPYLREVAGQTKVGDSLFLTSGLFTTCAGGAAMIDCFLGWVFETYGGLIASRVANRQVVGAPRSDRQTQPGRASDRRRSAPKSLAQAIDFIEKNYQDHIASEQLAAASGVSVRQLERLFAAYLGHSPSQHLRNTRLENALIMLDETKLSILDIALASGFSSVSTFNKSFKARYRLRPSDYRKRLRAAVRN